MGRLIDREEAKKMVCQYSVFRAQLGGLMDVVSFLDDQTTVDAVPVVRCRECKHCDPESHHCDHHMGTAAPLRRKPDDFCSYGERKEGDD